MASNRDTRRVYGNADINNMVDLPPVGPMPYNVPTDGMVQINPPSPGPTVQTPRWQDNRNANPVGFRTNASDVGVRAVPQQPSRPTQGGAQFHGIEAGRGYQRMPDGTIKPIPIAAPRRDPTGDWLGRGISLGVGALGGGPLGLLGGPAGRWISRMIREGKIRRASAPDTLARGSTGRTGGLRMPVANPNDPAVRNQQGGYNLGRGMEGTYLDRTPTSAGQFAASQRSNQMANDMRNPSVGPSQPDFPSHIYHGDENGEGARHAVPGQARLASNPGYSTTREAMDMRNGVLGAGGRNAPVTAMSFMDRLNAARGIQPEAEPQGPPMLTTAQPLTYDPRMMGPYQAGQEPSRAQILLSQLQRGRGR